MKYDIEVLKSRIITHWSVCTVYIDEKNPNNVKGKQN